MRKFLAITGANSISKVGQHAFTTARMLILAATLLFAATTARAEDCTLLKVASLDMQLDEHGQAVVTVKVNDSDRKFLLDTGGVFTGVKDSLTHELGLRQHSIDNARIYLLSGKKVNTYVSVDRLGLGISTARNAKLMVLPDSALPAGIDGLLSPDYLSNFDLDLDLPGHVVNLISPKHCKGKVVYWTTDYARLPFSLSTSLHIIVPVLLDGQKILAGVDTGSSLTVLSETVAKRRLNITESSPGVEAPRIANGGIVKFRSYFQTLALDGVAINHPLVYVRSNALERAESQDESMVERTDPRFAPNSQHDDLLIGTDILNRLHVYIAYKEHMLYVSAGPTVKTVVEGEGAEPRHE